MYGARGLACTRAVAAVGEPGDVVDGSAVARAASSSVEERELALADDAVVEARERLERALRDGADVRAAEDGHHVRAGSAFTRAAMRAALVTEIVVAERPR